MNTQQGAGHSPAVKPGRAVAAEPLAGMCRAAHGSPAGGSMSPGWLHAGAAADRAPQDRPSLAESYDHYYGSGVYDARYPRPNPSTYRSALRLVRASARILDFGAGSGRYALPFLHATNAFVCAYDISADACKALELRAAAAGYDSERLLVTADFDAARAAGPYDLVTSLFGVLSHIEGKQNRIRILTSIRSALTRQGLLLLTVPHALRRFPLHVSSDGRSSESSGAFPGRGYARRCFPAARPVTYQHRLENEDRLFPYYLFSRRELAAELSAAGLTVEVLESDSILPERVLARNPALAPADDFLCRLLPTWAGYGLRAICRVDPSNY